MNDRPTSRFRFHVLFAALYLSLACVSCQSKPAQAGQHAGPLRKVAKESRTVVLFEDFGNNSLGVSKRDFEGLTRGLPSLIVNDFLQIGAYRPVVAEDRLKALSELALSRSGLTDGEGLRVGKILGAKLLLRGEFSESAGLLTITARAVDVETGETIASIHAFGPTELAIKPPDALIKRISLGLMQRLALQLQPEEVEVLRTNVESTDIHALDSNYRGEKLAELAALARMRRDPSKAEADPELDQEIIELDNLAGAYYEEAAASDPRYVRSRRNLGSHSQKTGRSNFAANIRPDFRFGRVLAADSPAWMRRSPLETKKHKLRTGVLNPSGKYSPSFRRRAMTKLPKGVRFNRRGPGMGIVNPKFVRLDRGRFGKFKLGKTRVGKVRVGKVKLGKVSAPKVNVPKFKAPKVKAPKVKISTPKFKK